MSASFRGDPGDKLSGGPGLNDDAFEAAAEHPPALKVSIGLAELIFGMFANCVQVATSAIAILSMIVGASSVLFSPSDAVKSFGWKAVIALVISLSIQLFLHKNSQPMSSTFHRLRQIQHFNIKSTHAWSDVFSYLSFGMLYFALALAADIISDATFVNLFTRNPYVIVFWMLFLTGSSTLLFYDGATRIWGALEDWKDYRAYHNRHDVPRSTKGGTR
ncbi:MAG: hypothetical protein M3Y81_18075 [Chloroflexota bacterium]|nr:hypothetical protein [Chloroflexota bacterium]